MKFKRWRNWEKNDISKIKSPRTTSLRVKMMEAIIKLCKMNYLLFVEDTTRSEGVKIFIHILQHSASTQGTWCGGRFPSKKIILFVPPVLSVIVFLYDRDWRCFLWCMGHEYFNGGGGGGFKVHSIQLEAIEDSFSYQSFPLEEKHLRSFSNPTKQDLPSSGGPRMLYINKREERLVK